LLFLLPPYSELSLRLNVPAPVRLATEETACHTLQSCSVPGTRLNCRLVVLASSSSETGCVVELA
jgi:hypothetical protein